MNFSDLVQARRSVRDYDLAQPVTDADLKAIFNDVILSPSAFNLQQWAFVVVREAEQKKRLRAASMDQAQVENCGAAIVVCAKLDAHVDAPTIFAQVPEPMRERMIGMTAQMYGGNAQFARDEAIRGASLASMTLMYAAKARYSAPDAADETLYHGEYRHWLSTLCKGLERDAGKREVA